MADNESDEKEADIPPVVKPKGATGKSNGLPKPDVPDDTSRIHLASSGDEAPPKVTITDQGKSDTLRIDIGATDSGPAETARIDIGDTKLPDTEPDDTARIDLNTAEEDKAGTDRISLDTAKPAGEETARIDLSAEKPSTETDRINLQDAKPTETARISLEEAKKSDTAKSSTDRIDLSDAHPPSDEDDMDEFTSATLDPAALEAAQQAAQAAAGEPPKSETDRIDLAETRAPVADTEAMAPRELSEDEKRDLMMRSTMPIDALDATDEDAMSKATVPIDALEEPGAMANATMPIEALDDADLDEAGLPSKDDIMMRSTVPIQVDLDDETAPPSDAKEASTTRQIAAMKNQTMRVVLDDSEMPPKGDTAKLDELTPATAATSDPGGTARVDLDQAADSDEDIFKRATGAATVASLAGAAAAPKKKIKKPSAPMAPKSETARIDVAPATKGATARIEVPPEDIPQAPPRPKGIKLKRAESSSVKKPAASGSSLQPAGSADLEAEDDAVSVLTGVMSLLTLVAMGVLVYVLAAQSIAPDLPWPGRL